MRWLFRLFFLERWWKEPANEVRRPVPMIMYSKEFKYKIQFESLIHFLQGQLQEPVYYSVDEKARAIIATVEDTIAEVSIHPKGANQEVTYIVVRLEVNYEMYKIWFDLAFVGLKLSYGRPLLKLRRISSILSRGH